MNTVYKYEKILGTGTVVENRDEGSFIWENEYDRESHINEYALTLFLPAGKTAFMKKARRFIIRERIPWRRLRKPCGCGARAFEGV